MKSENIIAVSVRNFISNPKSRSDKLNNLIFKIGIGSGSVADIRQEATQILGFCPKSTSQRKLEAELTEYMENRTWKKRQRNRYSNKPKFYARTGPLNKTLILLHYPDCWINAIKPHKSLGVCADYSSKNDRPVSLPTSTENRQ